MPKILASDDMQNFEVLKWIRDTKQRHAEEDAAAEAEGLVLKPRPANFKKVMDTHERHLTRDVYPFEKNPSVYNENIDIDDLNTKLYRAVLKSVHQPIQEKYKAKIRAKELTVKEAQAKFDEETEPKTFADMEIDQLQNLAPKNMETLQLIIEQWEERFTEAEMQLVLEAVQEVLRADELAEKKARKNKNKNQE